MSPVSIMDWDIHAVLIMAVMFCVCQQNVHAEYGDLCGVDICRSMDNAPQCPQGQGVILLREVLNTSGNTLTLGSCTKAGVFSLLAKVCNARHRCEGHLLRQIQDQCCQSSLGRSGAEKMEVTYYCIQENEMYNVCSSHRLPVPEFHRHVLSPNFTDEASRKDTMKLPFCQWSIHIPAGTTLTLTVNDLYVGPRATCDGETSFRLQYMDSSQVYKHLPSSALCGEPGSNLPVEGFSRKPISIPKGSSRAVIWFTPVNYKERLWFSYQFLDASKQDVSYGIPSKLGCGSYMYRETTTTTAMPTTAMQQVTSAPVPSDVPNLAFTILTTSVKRLPAFIRTTPRTRKEAATPVHPEDKPVTKLAALSPWQYTGIPDQNQHLQRFVLIGALAGVAVVAVVFLITSLILFTKLMSRPRSQRNGLVRFIKADRLDSKPVVMEVECVDRTSPNFNMAFRPRKINTVTDEPRERTMSMLSSESPIYAQPYKQPSIRYGSGKRNKALQHRVMIIEEPCRKSADFSDRTSGKRGSSPTIDEDMLSLISGCTVTSSGVSVSDGDTADLKELMNSLKKDSTGTSNTKALTPKVPSVKVRAEIRRPRFPPDVAIDPIVRLPVPAPDAEHATNLYVNGHRLPHDGGYELCRPFPVCNEDYDIPEQK